MIRVYADPEEVSAAAAALFASEACRAVARQGRFAVLLAGGTTPRRCYELLAQAPLRDRIPWGEVHVFWGDERCVPGDDPRSNAGMARRALLHHVPLPPAQVHPIVCEPSPQEGAEAYAAVLRAFFADGPPRFDLVLLGLGDEGHTLSLFPGDSALGVRECWTTVTHRRGEDMDRVTLTAPVINRAAQVAFLVTGEGKAAILREVLEGGADPHQLPARLVRPEDGELLWLVDRKAGSLLRHESNISLPR
ncbi:MAG TPA: 6-phosphogluconolactonase [Geobacteraceae bacterium]